ncbi:hypothetical protein BDV96DRAFT_474364, partial [Lophiotrema nucula]
PAAYALLESSFKDVSQLKAHKQLPRRSNDFRNFAPVAEPLKHDVAYLEDDNSSVTPSTQITPLASPGALNGTETGLPPTPPSNSEDEKPPTTSFSPPPRADGVVLSLMARKSSLGTPVNQRSPPTPDPSPPRTTESMTLPERPNLFAYPSSRAESFKTAREEQLSSEAGDSRTNTPLAERLNAKEDRGLGLAFERDESDATPTNRVQNTYFENQNEQMAADREPLREESVPNREWDTNLMRNVTVRRRRKPLSPHKDPHTNSNSTTEAHLATGSSLRRSSSLRDRVEASKSSPHTPSIDNFAQSIGWPSEAQETPSSVRHDTDSKRHSVSSMTSTVVEVMVIPSPPQRQRTLRHTGRNLALRRDTDSFTDRSSHTGSNRNSMNSDDIPLHRLVHKRASISERRKRISSESDTLGFDYAASPLSVRKRGQQYTGYTSAHQESVRNVLQPAAELINRSGSLSRPHAPERSFHKRIASAPEPTRRLKGTYEPRTFLELSPPESPKEQPTTALIPPRIERTSPSTPGYQSHDASPVSPKLRSRKRSIDAIKSPLNVNKSLPELPAVSTPTPETQRPAPVKEDELLADIRPAVTLVGTSNEQQEEQKPHHNQANSPPETLPKRRTSSDSVPVVRRGSLTIRGRSEERRRSSTSQDRTSTSRDTLELPRRSHEWYGMHSDDHRRISLDRSTIRTEEHAMARHLFAQTTPFSQFSDTPIEVSEATAVSIYPHNNHSLLVVQQVARSSTLPLDESHSTFRMNEQPTIELSSLKVPSSPPNLEVAPDEGKQLDQPTFTVEPSTPPMQISLPVPGVVDSPLKNPRQAPEPPVIKFIPPTPADELDRQLVPGPPKRSDSHPQRRLSLVQRARRYSDNLISPLLARASSTRGRYVSDPHEHPRVPSVNDEESNLHPFWRPRGFWDGFDDSDSESDDDILPQGGDTSEVEVSAPAPPPRKMSVLGRRLTNGFKGPSGFLIGNSLGVERAGSNRRRHVVDLPARRSRKAPKILIQPPTLPLRTRSPRIEKRNSGSSMRSSGSYERSARNSRRASWRKGKTIPGLGVQVQYIGLSGVKEHFKEKKAEKRRNEIRQSIGSRYYVE